MRLERISALRGVSLSVEEGEIVALAGESGSGKTLTAYSILGLVDPPARLDSGSILFSGQELTGMSENSLRKIRGNQISMIFQEPMTSLNPVFTIGYQIDEVLITHKKMNRREARKKSAELLESVGITDPAMRLKQYPFELSGGMRQRVVIAMALATSPRLLIADEPTTSLDVTIQAQILNLIKDLNKNNKMAILLITHDLGIVGQLADKLAVMYAGQIMEFGNTRKILKEPAHPYTRGLLNSLPRLEGNHRLEAIPGTPPELTSIPAGCPFYPRCPERKEECKNPVPIRKKSGSFSRCIL